MLELLLASIVITGITPLVWMVYSNYKFEQKSEFAGEHIARINRAVDAYVAQNADILTNVHDAAKVTALIAAGTYPAWKANVPHIGVAPNPCAGGANPCVRLPIDRLVDSGFLTYADSQTNNWGLSYDLIIKMTDTGQGPRLDSMLATVGVLDRPEKTGPGVVSWDALADAINKGGLNIGVVRTVTAADTNLLNGVTLTAGALAAYGPSDAKNSQLGWVEKAGDWPNLTTEGQLVARAGYNASAWAAYLRLSGGQMTGPIDMNDNSVKNAKSLSFSASGINYNDVCADSTGAAVKDGQAVTIVPTTGAAFVDNTANRFGQGATAQWTPPAGSTISAQSLQCLKATNGVFRWAKPSAAPLTIQEITEGMMDGWVSEPALLCGVGYTPSALANKGGESGDWRNLIRFKLKHRGAQPKSSIFMQVWTGDINGAVGRATVAGALIDPMAPQYASQWVDIDVAGVVDSYFAQTDNGVKNVSPVEENANIKFWQLPLEYSIPFYGTVCISGANNLWIPGSATPFTPLTRASRNDTRGATDRRYGIYNSAAGLGVSSAGVQIGWSGTTVIPVVTDDLANYGQQVASQTIKNATYTYELGSSCDPLGGCTYFLTPTAHDMTIAAPVSYGHSLNPSAYKSLPMLWIQREAN